MKNLHYYTERLDTLQVLFIGLLFCALILIIWVFACLAVIAIRKMFKKEPKPKVNRFKADLADEADFKDARKSITLIAVLILFIIIFSIRSNGQGKLRSAARTRVDVQHQ